MVNVRKGILRGDEFEGAFDLCSLRCWHDVFLPYSGGCDFAAIALNGLTEALDIRTSGMVKCLRTSLALRDYLPCRRRWLCL